MTQHTHSPHCDADGDVVCSGCGEVLGLGPLGVNGISPSGFDYKGRSTLTMLMGVRTSGKKKGAE